MQFIMEEFDFEDLDLDNEWLKQLEKDNEKYKDFYRSFYKSKTFRRLFTYARNKPTHGVI